jgi:hypothetical protein
MSPGFQRQRDALGAKAGIAWQKLDRKCAEPQKKSESFTMCPGFHYMKRYQFLNAKSMNHLARTDFA